MKYFKKVYKDPTILTSKADLLTKKSFNDLLHFLINEENKKTTKLLKEGVKRKRISYVDYIVISNYWSSKMPNQYIQKWKQKKTIFHNDHMIPISTRYEGRLALDRLGNFSPIMRSLNCKRGNKHIKIYWSCEESKEIIDHLGIFPSNEQYDKMVQYKKNGSNNSPYIKSVIEYNEFCKKNEEIYINTFVDRLF